MGINFVKTYPDIINELEDEISEEVLKQIDQEDSQSIKQLLNYDEESAGGLMTTEVLYFEAHLTVSQMLEKIREHRDELETANYIYITDSKRRIVGIITLRQLIMRSPDEPVENFMESESDGI